MHISIHRLNRVSILALAVLVVGSGAAVAAATTAATTAVQARFAEGDTQFLPLVVNLGASATPATDWPTLAANPQRTSSNAVEVRGDLNVAWYRPIEPYIPYKIQPIAANGKIYVATARGLYAFNAGNGSLLWVYPTALPLGHSPTIAEVNGRRIAFVGGFDRVIHAIDAETGTAVAGYTPYVAGAGFETNPLVVGNTIFAGNRDGTFYALNAVTGSLKWQFKTDASIAYSAAYKDNVVYFASNDAHAYALSAGNGALIWKSAKLPGSGFHTYWPVVYTQRTTGETYVVFTSGENYRFAVMNLVIEESDTVYDGIPGEAPIGPTTTAVAGDWAPGTVAIDASVLTNYYEARPDRRTVFVLNAANGQEFSFDSDGDGRREYAPFNWSGVTHSGSKYPPIVNGRDGVYYQATGYIAPGWISRGGPVGWKFGTQYISRVDGKDNAFASDEPLAYATGGRLIYYTLCCDRVAGAMDVTIPFGQPDRAWTYFEYNLASNALAPGYQQMYNGGNAADYNNENGWQSYRGRNQSQNGFYGKHGSNQSPPIPYDGKVYMLKGNALIAFSPTGTNPRMPLPLAEIVPAPTATAVPTRAEVAQRLETEVQKMLAAGPLRPGYHDAGFLDLYGNGRFTDARTLGELFDYFQNPADTVYTLLLAYPHLSSATRQQVRQYLQTHYGPGAQYDFTRIVHVGWGTGAAREHLIIPAEVVAQWGDPYTSPFAPATEPVCGWCGYWQHFPPFSFYAAWQYAQIVGNGNAAFARSLFDRISGKLEAPLSDATFTQKPYWLNQYIAGYKGYLELQKLAGYAQDPAVVATYNDLLALRVSSFAKDTPFPPLGYGGPDWELSYQNATAVARNFMFLTPELADYLAQQIRPEVAAAVAEYEYVAPYWFVSHFDSTYGEGTFQPLYDAPALFQAKAGILDQPFDELAQWLDAPAFYRGDLFYIQNLAAALEASQSNAGNGR